AAAENAERKDASSGVVPRRGLCSERSWLKFLVLRLCALCVLCLQFFRYFPDKPSPQSPGRAHWGSKPRLKRSKSSWAETPSVGRPSERLPSEPPPPGPPAPARPFIELTSTFWISRVRSDAMRSRALVSSSREKSLRPSTYVASQRERL